MDNFKFDITACGNLEPWLACIMSYTHKAAGWSAHNDEKGSRLILYWVQPKGVDGYHPLPSPATADQVTIFAKAWLDATAFGSEPDHDGDNSHGWRLYNEDWGHVDGHYQAFIAIAPAWAMHGK